MLAMKAEPGGVPPFGVGSTYVAALSKLRFAYLAEKPTVAYHANGGLIEVTPRCLKSMTH